MSDDLRALADAVLHEGYLLYPYARSALKNLHPHPFGTLYPEEFCRAADAGDCSIAGFECVALGGDEASAAVVARFLQLGPEGPAAREVMAGARRFAELATAPENVSFEFGAIRGELSVVAMQVSERAWKLGARIANLTPLSSAPGATRDGALQSALLSAHILLEVERAELVSAIDPPANLLERVRSCRQIGLWPVLAGRTGSRAAMLASPIVLYDHPQIAAESPGDFFDGTEIDAMLTLRVLTLTDEEKRAMAEGDPRARAILERTERLGLERMGSLHGRLERSERLRPGARVRLRPTARADIFDVALAGKRATIESIEHDLEGRAYVAVTIDEDPGRDLGAFGHRFFFRPEEVVLE